MDDWPILDFDLVEFLYLASGDCDNTRMLRLSLKEFWIYATATTASTVTTSVWRSRIRFIMVIFPWC